MTIRLTKKLRHRNKFLGQLVAATTLIASVIATPQAIASDDPIVLRGVTPWIADYDLSQPFFMFQELVREKTNGEVIISYLGGEEVIPSREQAEAVRSGVIDLSVAAVAYYGGQVPAANGIYFTELPPTELRESGFFEIMEDVHSDAGLKYLANTSGVNQFRMYSRVAIEEPSFEGLNVRVSPVYIALVEGLNGSPVSMAPTEIYTGLERGVVDAFGWTYLGVTDFGWHEVSNYVIDHPFYALDGALLMNPDSWDAIPEHLQEKIAEAAVELEAMVEEQTRQAMIEEDEALRDAGMNFISFSDNDAEYFITTAYEAAWDRFFEEFPELGPRMREAGSSQSR